MSQTSNEQKNTIEYLGESAKDFEWIKQQLYKADMVFKSYPVKHFYEFEKRFQKESASILLADMHFPDVQKYLGKISPDVSVILIADAADEERAITLVGKNIVDYVLREHPARLPVIIKRLHAKERENRANNLVRANFQKSDFILQAMSDSVVVTDTRGLVTFWNNGAKALYGYTAEEMLGQPISIIYSTENLPLLQQMITDLMNEKQIPAKELSCICKSGQTVNVSLTLSPKKSKNGDIVEFIGIAQKITETFCVQQELAENRSFLQSIYDNTPIGIFVIDVLDEKYFRFVGINKRQEELVGIKNSDIQGKKPQDLNSLLGKDIADYLENLYMKCIQARHQIVVEENKVLPIGQIWLSTRITPLFNEKGKIYRLLGACLDVSDVKKTVHDLKESKSRLREITKQIPGCVFQFKIDAQGNAGMVFMSDQAEQIFDNSMDNLLNPDKLLLNIHPDDQQAFGDSIAYSKEHLSAWELTYRIIWPRDHSVHWIHGRSIPHKESDGAVVWNGVLYDITEQRTHQLEIQELRDFYRLVLNNIQDGIWVTDKNDRMTFFNPGMEKIAGVSAADVLGMSVTADFPPETTDHFLQFYQKAKNLRAPQPYQADVTTPAGRLTIQAGWLVPRFEDEKFNGMICTIQDITEQKRAEKQLEESERQMGTLLDNLQGMVYRCQNVKNWTMEFVSEGCKDLTGYDPEELLYDKIISYGEIIHPKDRNYVAKIVSRAENDFKKFELEYRIIDKKGEEKWVWERGQFIAQEDQPIMLEGIIQDITAHKKADFALEKSEKTFRTIIESSPLAIHIYELDEDENMIFSGYNKAADRMLGVENAKFMGMTLQQAFAPLTETELPEKYFRAAKYGDNYYSEQVDYNSGPLEGHFELYAFQMSPGKVAVMFNDITERKRAELEILKNEERLRRIIENMPVMMDAFDKDLKIIAWNKECERVTGYSADEVVGKVKALDAFYPEKENLFKRIEDLRRNDVDFRDHEYTLIAKDGSPRTISWSNIASACPIPGWYTWGIGVDVTERKKAEQALLQNEQEVKLLIENSVDVIWKMDLRLNFTFVNHAIYQLTGYTPDEWLGTNLAQHSTRKEFFKMARQALSAVKNYKNFNYAVFESEIIKKNGESIPVEIIGKLVLNEKGLPIAVQGTTRDISERKVAEETKRKLANRINTVLQTGNLAWWEVDSTSDAFVFDSTLLKMLNCSEKAINTFTKFNALVHPNDAAMKNKNLRDHLSGKADKFQAEYRIQTKDGGYKWFRDIGIVTDRKLHGKNAYRLVGIIEDVTDRKELEEQLLQSQKMDAIGTLAGGLAHDFNNLLTIINGYAELMSEFDLEDSLLSDAVENIAQAGSKAASLTKQLLAFSRTSMIQPTIFDINTVIAEMHRMLLRLLGENIQFNLHFEKSNIAVKADKSQFEQIVMNLVVNAREAMPSGGRLDLYTKIVTFKESPQNALFEIEPGKYAEIIIKDNGVGMEETTKRRIFEPFFTSKKTGTGLGLSTVFGIVKRSGGFISVDSNPGQGTSFHVYLPLTTQSPKKVEQEQPKDVKGGHETILVVDDEEVIISFLKKVLEKYGYTVYAANSAEDAIKKYADQLERFDLLITDVIMTGKDGSMLVEHFSKLSPDLSYFFISGYMDLGDVMFADLIKASKLIQKPFDKYDLLRLVRSVLDNKK